MLQKITGQNKEAMESFRHAIDTGRKDFIEWSEAGRKMRELEPPKK